MAVLASKGTASVTLAIGATLNVLAGGQGVAVLKGGAYKGQSVELGASVRKIGPFPFAMPITINSQSGALTYYVGADSAAPHVEIAGEYDAASGQTVLDDASRAAVRMPWCAYNVKQSNMARWIAARESAKAGGRP